MHSKPSVLKLEKIFFVVHIVSEKKEVISLISIIWIYLFCAKHEFLSHLNIAYLSEIIIDFRTSISHSFSTYSLLT